MNQFEMKTNIIRHVLPGQPPVRRRTIMHAGAEVTVSAQGTRRLYEILRGGMKQSGPSMAWVREQLV